MNVHLSDQAFMRPIIIHTSRPCRYPLLAWTRIQKAAPMDGIYSRRARIYGVPIRYAVDCILLSDIVREQYSNCHNVFTTVHPLRLSRRP